LEAAVTDRHSAYIVTLDEDVRSDDAERIIAALGMVKGVLSVEPVVADNFAAHIERERVGRQWRGALLDLLENGPKEDR
jgi:hypothetical protein